MPEGIRHLAWEESGQDLIEYALLAGFVTLVVVTTATNLGQAVNNIFAGVDAGVGSIPAP